MAMRDYTLKEPSFAGSKTVTSFQDVGRIRYNGLVHLGDMFSAIRGWFKKHKYVFVEKTVKHKYGSGGLEKEYEWRPFKKQYDYLKYEVRMLFKIKDIVDVEVIRDGKKEKLQQCRLLITIEPILYYDPNKRLAGKGPLTKNLSAIYHRFFVKQEMVKKWQDDYENHIKDLKKFIEKYLEFESTITV